MSSKISDIKRVLMVSTTAIGDTLLGTPALRAVKESYPNAKIDFLIHSKRADIISGNPFADHIYCYRNNPLYRYRLKRILRKVEYDYIVILHANKDIIPFLKGLKYREIINCQSFREPSSNIRLVDIPYTIHAADRRLRLVAEIGAYTDHKRLELFLSEDDIARGDNFFKRHHIDDNDIVVGIQLAAANSYKCWPIKNYVPVINYLERRYKAKVIINGTKGEKGLYNELIKRLHREGNPYPFTAGLPIKVSSAVIKRCNLFITCDTGPMHIAYAVGTPTIALFCPSDSKTIGPYNCPSPYIVIAKSVPCVPCITKRCRDSFCMSSISVEEVIKAVGRLL